MTMEDNTEDLTAAYMLGKYDGRKEAQSANSRCSDSAGSRYWIVTVDHDPMPYEYWTSPFQIVHGTEDFVKSYCDSLNAKKGPALYEYSDPANQEILFENERNNHE